MSDTLKTLEITEFNGKFSPLNLNSSSRHFSLSFFLPFLILYPAQPALIQILPLPLSSLHLLIHYCFSSPLSYPPSLPLSLLHFFNSDSPPLTQRPN